MQSIKSLFLSLLMLYGVNCLAQDDKLNYDLDYAKTSKQNGGATFLKNQVNLNFPIKTGTKSGLTIGPEFGILNISNTASLADTSTLMTLGFKIGFHTFISQSTVFFAEASPLLASDFQDISGEDMRFRANAVFMFHFDRKFAYGFGLGYQYQFSGSQLLPMITMVWHITDGITLSGPLPLIPRLDFKLNDKWSIGGGIKGDYSSYRLSASKWNSQYVQYSNFNFGFNSKYKPNKRLEFGGFLGVGTRAIDVYNKTETIPLRIFGWDIGGGSHVPNFARRYKGFALNFNMAYKIW